MFHISGKLFTLQVKFCEVCGGINIACGDTYVLLFSYEIDHSGSDAETLN